MKRLWFSAAVILFAVLLVGFFGFAWLIPLAAAALIVGGVAVLMWLPARERLWRDVMFYAFCVLLSCAFAYPTVSDYRGTVAAYAGKTVNTTVTICEDPVLCSDGSYRCVARPDASVFSQKFVFFSKLPLSSAGGKITGRFRFGKAEEVDFDYLSRGVVLSATLLSDEAHLTVTDPAPSFRYLSARLRGRVRNVFSEFIQREQAGFMTSVLTGDKDGLSDALYDGLSQTGMLHIVAVSGLHVSAFVAFVLYFLRKIRNVRLKLFFSILSLSGILLLAGFTPSVVRAVLMNAFAFTERSYGASALPLNRLGAAGILILLFDPFAALSLSFQLSFAATFGILLLGKELTHGAVEWLFLKRNLRCGGVLRFFVTGLCVSFAAFLFTFPVLWLRVGSFSAWSILLTPLLLPVLEFCVFAALFLLFVSWIPLLLPLCRFTGMCIAFGARLISYTVRRCAAVAGSVEISSALVRTVGAGVLILLIAFLFFARQKHPKRRRKEFYRRSAAFVSSVAVLLLCVYQFTCVFTARYFVSPAPEEGVFQTTYFSTGDGSCSVSVCRRSAFMVDCGGTKPSGRIAADYLSACGIETVDFVILTDLSPERISGLQEFCARKTVRKILFPSRGNSAEQTVCRLAESAGAQAVPVREETTLGFVSAWVRLILCFDDAGGEDPSLAVLTEYGDYRSLFCSALSAKKTDRFLARFGTLLDCDVITLPEKAAEAEVGLRLLSAASPRYAILSVGSESGIGLPTAEMQKQLRTWDTSLLRTDLYSTITVRTDGGTMEVMTEK